MVSDSGILYPFQRQNGQPTPKVIARNYLDNLSANIHVEDVKLMTRMFSMDVQTYPPTKGWYRVESSMAVGQGPPLPLVNIQFWELWKWPMPICEFLNLYHNNSKMMYELLWPAGSLRTMSRRSPRSSWLFTRPQNIIRKGFSPHLVVVKSSTFLSVDDWNLVATRHWSSYLSYVEHIPGCIQFMRGWYLILQLPCCLDISPKTLKQLWIHAQLHPQSYVSLAESINKSANNHRS